MSLWGDNPEWFDEWIEKRALSGAFGPIIQKHVEEGELLGYELWVLPELQDRLGDLGTEATADFCERG